MRNSKSGQSGRSNTPSILIIVLVAIVMGGFVFFSVTSLDIIGGDDTKPVNLKYTNIDDNLLRIEWQSGIEPEVVVLKINGNGSFINTKQRAELTELGDSTTYSMKKGDVLSIWVKYNKNGDESLVEKRKING